jgi:hypothetical protein
MKMGCENLNGCLFYTDKMPIDSGIGQLQKIKYCEENKKLCARYKVAASIGKENVPTDLYPHMVMRANKVIEDYFRNARLKF